MGGKEIFPGNISGASSGLRPGLRLVDDDGDGGDSDASEELASLGVNTMPCTPRALGVCSCCTRSGETTPGLSLLLLLLLLPTPDGAAMKSMSRSLAERASELATWRRESYISGNKIKTYTGELKALRCQMFFQGRGMIIPKP